MFKPKYNAVVVKELELQEETYGNIFVANMDETTNRKAKVLAVGPGNITLMGETVPVQTKVGEIVILPTAGFTKFSHKGEEYLIGKENELLTEIKEEDNE